MTSRNLFFKLMAENAKRRLWIIALSSLTFFFSFPVAMAMVCGEHDLYSYVESEAAMERVLENTTLLLLNQNGWIVFLMMTAAVLCGVSSFSYLHSKKKADFFHSIPVRRETLFGVNYLNGILIVAVPYLINLILAFAVMGMNGLQTGPFVGMALKTYVFHMAHFLLLYGVVVLAMMMTGNIVIGILGNVVFSFYVPCVTLLLLGCGSAFFQSFYPGSFNWITDKLYRISPFISYILNFMAWNDGGDMALAAAIVFASAIAIAGLALCLYRIRPSEAAGKAMAFVKTQPFIKVLLVIPSAIAGGIFFWVLRESDAWGIFGMVCGLLLPYCFIEIVYNMDFRKLFAHKHHLGFCGIAAVIIMSIFRFDLLGYDSYLPKESSIESSSIYISNLDGWIDYNSLELQETEGMKPSVEWSYKSSIESVFKNMNVTSNAEILSIAKAGIEHMDLSVQRDRNYDSGSDYGEEDELYSRIYIQYHLKNGRKPVRSYTVNLTSMMEEADKLYQNPEYKQGVFPLLTLSTDEIAGINYEERGEYRHVTLGEDGSDKKALLEAYQSEMTALSLETRKKESPICTLQFKTNEMQNAIDVLRAAGSDEWTSYNEISYYPVYPSFTKTIDILKKTGILAGQEYLKLSDIQRIEIDFYRTRDNKGIPETEDDRFTLVILKENELKQVMDAAIWQDYAHRNPLNRIDDYNITFFKNVKEPGVNDSEDFDYLGDRYYIDADKVPEFVKEHIASWQ